MAPQIRADRDLLGDAVDNDEVPDKGVEVPRLVDFRPQLRVVLCGQLLFGGALTAPRADHLSTGDLSTSKICQLWSDLLGQYWRVLGQHKVGKCVLRARPQDTVDGPAPSTPPAT
jgi:hypothetical protein